MNAPFVIGIAGGSASGKSTLSAALIERLLPRRTVLLPHDAYYRGAPDGSDPAHINYDHPDSIDTALCAEHLRLLRERQTVSIPVYDFSAHARKHESRTLAPATFIIVEGILVLHESALRAQMDLRLYVETADDVRYERRCKRDRRERGRTEESVRRQWESTVLPMHAQYVEPSKAHAHVIVDGCRIDELTVRALAETTLQASRLV